MTLSNRLGLFLTTGVMASAPGMAFAHVGLGDAHDALHGFLHPLTGIDHILAMVSVGLLAAHLGGRALFAVPLSFVAMMVVGGALGMAGLSMPVSELGIALSVLVLGGLLAMGSKPPVALAMVLAGTFAIFHGYAHGMEMPDNTSGLSFGLGFVAATAMLHCAGLFAGLAIGRLSPRIAKPILTWGGRAIALMGLALVAGLV